MRFYGWNQTGKHRPPNRWAQSKFRAANTCNACLLQWQCSVPSDGFTAPERRPPARLVAVCFIIAPCWKPALRFPRCCMGTVSRACCPNGTERRCPTRSSQDCQMSALNSMSFGVVERAAAETVALRRPPICSYRKSTFPVRFYGWNQTGKRRPPNRRVQSKSRAANTCNACPPQWK